MECTIHPNRPAVACCALCQKPFCRACLTEKDGKRICIRCQLIEEDSVTVSSEELSVSAFPVHVPLKRKSSPKKTS